MDKGDAVKRGRSAAPSQVESQTRPSAAAGERAKSAAPAEPQLKKEEARSDDETTGGAASAPEPEATQLKSAVEIQKRQMNNAAAESPLQTKARQLATPSAPAPLYRMESRGLVSFPPTDSAAIRDSLRLDSLKRAEKTRLDSLKRAKARRPGGL